METGTGDRDRYIGRHGQRVKDRNMERDRGKGTEGQGWKDRNRGTEKKTELTSPSGLSNFTAALPLHRWYLLYTDILKLESKHPLLIAVVANCYSYNIYMHYTVRKVKLYYLRDYTLECSHQEGGNTSFTIKLSHSSSSICDSLSSFQKIYNQCS